MSNLNFDYLILGQGLAGSLVGWNLEQAEQNYLIFDFPHQNSATRISAGIVNPLIGRSFNLPWNYLELTNTAKKFYQELTNHFGQAFLYEQKILRVLNNNKQLEILETKQQDPSYQSFIGSIINQYGNLRFPQQAFWTKESYWIDLAKLQRHLKEFFISKHKYQELKLDYQLLRQEENSFRYENYKFKKIIFADGYRAINNPLASFLEFRPAKGEIINLKIPNLNLDSILNFGHFLLPLGEDLYRLGATYGWSDWETKLPLNTEHPLLMALTELIDLPFEIISQQLGVRPIVAGQKPVVGPHPSNSQVYFINGLGSKGALQAPYCAKVLVEHLLLNRPISSEISTSRFS